MTEEGRGTHTHTHSYKKRKFYICICRVGGSGRWRGEEIKSISGSIRYPLPPQFRLPAFFFSLFFLLPQHSFHFSLSISLSFSRDRSQQPIELISVFSPPASTYFELTAPIVEFVGHSIFCYFMGMLAHIVNSQH